MIPALRWLRSKLAPGSVILMYHRVTSVDSDPWQLCVSPQHFGEHLEVLRKMARPIGLAQLSRALADGAIPRRAVAVTFDDGYADNLYNAKPLLERADVPATVFLATGHIGADREFWWDDLGRLLLHPGPLPAELCLTIQGCNHHWELAGGDAGDVEAWDRSRRWIAWGEEMPTARHALYRSLYELLQPLPVAECRSVMRALAEWAGASPEGRPSHRTMTRDEVLESQKGGLVEIGAHTVNHPFLAAAPESLQKDEIETSKATLEQLLDRPVTLFAYPYGRRCDYTPETVSVVRQAGFACACSNFPGRIERGADPYQLPRMHVLDCGGEEFARRISRWLN